MSPVTISPAYMSHVDLVAVIVHGYDAAIDSSSA